LKLTEGQSEIFRGGPIRRGEREIVFEKRVESSGRYFSESAREETNTGIHREGRKEGVMGGVSWGSAGLG